VDILIEKGIRPIKQRYVHLSTSIEKALEVASIHTDDPVLIKINAAEAQNDGLSLLTANDNIVLADEIPPQYLSLVQDELQ
jgi:putative RNA 2'-phosphotransferase